MISNALSSGGKRRFEASNGNVVVPADEVEPAPDNNNDKAINDINTSPSPTQTTSESNDTSDNTTNTTKQTGGNGRKRKQMVLMDYVIKKKPTGE